MGKWHGTQYRDSLYADAVREALGAVHIRDAWHMYARATGGWRATAEHKLLSAGFPLEGIPLASADDHQDRVHIMLHALGQLEGPFASITYFGDGVWDRAATAQLGWEFVAVGPKLGGLSDFDAVPPNIALQQSDRRSAAVTAV